MKIGYIYAMKYHSVFKKNEICRLMDCVRNSYPEGGDPGSERQTAQIFFPIQMVALSSQICVFRLEYPERLGNLKKTWSFQGRKIECRDLKEKIVDY